MGRDFFDETTPTKKNTYFMARFLLDFIAPY
jgi:hypothetical protein